MRTRILIVTLALFAAFPCAAPAGAASDNPENYRTRCGDSGLEPVCDGPACQTCARSCHSAHFVNSGPGTLEVLGLPDPYIAGTQYALQAVLDDGTNADFVVGGFQLSALALYDRDGDLDDELCQGGVLESGEASTRVEEEAATGTLWLEHTAPKPATGGQAIWNFLWTAPTQPVGMVLLNACAVAADGDGSTATDWVYCSEFRVPPEVLPCPRFTVTADAAPEDADCAAGVRWSPQGNIPPTTWDVSVSADAGPFVPVAGCAGLVDEIECFDNSAPWGADLVYRVEGTDSCLQGPRTEFDDTDTPVRVTDLLPPVFPAPVTGATSVECDVTVTWDPAAARDGCSGVAGFRLYRSDGTDTCPAGTPRGEVMDPAASSLADNVPVDGDYYYWVRAVDRAGFEEDNCVTAQVTVTNCIGSCDDFTLEVAAAPGPGNCALEVSWTPGGNEGETIYDVEYSRGGRPFRDVPGCTGLANATNCTHDGLNWDDEYAYRVTATDSCPLGARVVSDETDALVRVTDGVPPVFDPPGTAASSTLCAVNISWDRDAVTDECSGPGGFRVYRSDGADTCPAGVMVHESGNPNSGGAADTVPDIGEYWYWVHAVDRSGNEEGNCVTASVLVTGCNVPEPIFPVGGVARDLLDPILALTWTESADGFNVYRGLLDEVAPMVTATGTYEQIECMVPGNRSVDLVPFDGNDYFYLVVPVLQGMEQGYGCVDPDANGGCNAEREPAADPCP